MSEDMDRDLLNNSISSPTGEKFALLNLKPAILRNQNMYLPC